MEFLSFLTTITILVLGLVVSNLGENRLFSKINQFRSIDPKSCKPQFKMVEDEMLLCFEPNDDVKVMGEKIKDQSCYKTDGEIFAYSCGKSISYRLKPKKHSNKCFFTSASVCHILSIIYKILVMFFLHILLRLFKEPILLVIHFLMKLIAKKTCLTCNQKYFISHSECNLGKKHKSVENLSLYYIILMFLTMVSIVRSAEVKDAMYENFEGYTKLRILDEENIVQDYIIGNEKLTFKVLHSFLEYKIEKSHEVGTIAKEMIPEKDYFCSDPIERCEGRYGKNKGYFIYRKTHDGFSCAIAQAHVCGFCEVEIKTIGQVYRIISIKPLVEIEVIYNNVSKIIKIEDNNRIQKSDDFIILPIAVNVNGKSLFYDNETIYKGNICNVPADGCFGDIIIGSNLRYDVKIIDNPETGLGVILEQCVKSNRYPIANLDKTNIKLIKGLLKKSDYMVENYKYGFIDILVTGRLHMDKFECEENKKKIVNIIVNGCHDCSSGYNIRIVPIDSTTECGKVFCKINDDNFSFYIKNKEVSFHRQSVRRNLNIDCNGYVVSIDLENSNEYNEFEVHKDLYVDTESHLFDDIKNIFKFDLIGKFKMVVLTTIFAIIVTFLVYEFFKHSKHMMRITKMRKDGYVVGKSTELDFMDIVD